MNENDKILIASYYALVWWSETLNQGFFQSSVFNDMHFSDKFVKSRLIDGQGTLALIMPSLYVALVLPREILFNNYKKQFEEIDNHLNNSCADRCFSTYPNEEKGQIKFTKHIRNAVAHASVEFTNDGILFKDKNPKNNGIFEATLKYNDLGYLVSKLSEIILNRVRLIQQNQYPSMSIGINKTN